VRSLLECAIVLWTAFLWSGEADLEVEMARKMARFICLPALCVSCLSLVVLFITMEPQYSSTFYKRDSRTEMHRRHWMQVAEWTATADEDRAYLTNSENVRYLGDLASEWIVQRAAEWELTRPEWYTEQWRRSVFEYAHFLGEAEGAGSVGGDEQGDHMCARHGRRPRH
jgi:hypothetical protein